MDHSQTWSADTLYFLSGPVLVASGATLTVEAGTRIEADRDALLLVERGARIEALGTREAPVVFTSSLPPGGRDVASWRGVLLLGAGPTQDPNLKLRGSGIPEESWLFGGGPDADPSANCGHLRYTRIEFAGGNTDEESFPEAALTLAGCGSATVVDHVQVHRATDGIGLIGGTVDLRHILVTNNSLGDAIEWTGGYQGTLQHVIVQVGSAAGLKGSNSDQNPTRPPVSSPRIYNATIAGIRPLIPSRQHFGVLLGAGSGAEIHNSILLNFEDGAFALRSQESAALVDPDRVSHFVLWENGADRVTHFTGAAAALDSDTMIVTDPGLESADDRTEPSFVPFGALPKAIAEIPEGFDGNARYHGALPPLSETSSPGDWTQKWTAFPEN